MNPRLLGPEFEALRAEYRQGLSARLEALAAQWAQAEASDFGAEPVNQLVRGLHALAGSAGTFGFPQVSKAARAAETFLEEAAGARLGPEQRQEFNRLLRELRALR